MAVTVHGRTDWSMSRDKEGDRTYKVKWLVNSTSSTTGPLGALGAGTLPSIGTAWAQGDDSDSSALCLPLTSCSYLSKNEKGFWWEVEQTFSTKPLSRCQTDTVTNPLSVPDRISGTFSKYTAEVQKDFYGNPIMSSSHELFRGSSVEFDANRPSVSVERNLATLPLSTFAPMVDTVNNSTMWGMGSRKVKLSNVSWTRKMYGTCTFYYTVKYDFNVRYDGFDRVVYDEGTKILNEEIENPNKNNPEHFTRYKDVNGDYSRVFLNGNGKMIKVNEDPVEIAIKYYRQSNFTTLGLPSSL